MRESARYLLAPQFWVAYRLNNMMFNKLSPMELKSFFIEYKYKNKNELAEVKTCCQEENTIYYDISIRNQYQFTVTPLVDEQNGLVWKVSLKNADKQVDPQLVKIIGDEIEKYLFSNSLTI